MSGLDEDEARDLLADHILGAYPVDPETGDPVGVSEVDAVQVRALRAPAAPAPGPTMLDAKAKYLAERYRAATAAEDAVGVRRIERVFADALAALGGDRELLSLQRSDARTVLKHLRERRRYGGGTLDPASVRRNVNDLKAALRFGDLELDLKGFDNPFDGLFNDKAAPPRSEGELRQPLPVEVMAGVRGKLLRLHNSNPELALVWRILQGTGCRLGEITGLRVRDVDLTGGVPTIRVEWHEERRLKTTASIRFVPLVGDALDAARAALALPRRHGLLFTRYGGQENVTNASTILNKHIDGFSEDRRHVVHSLRHNMADWLGDTPEAVQNRILGHRLKGTGKRIYGGEVRQKREARAALTKAIEEAGKQGFPVL